MLRNEGGYRDGLKQREAPIIVNAVFKKRFVGYDTNGVKGMKGEEIWATLCLAKIVKVYPAWVDGYTISWITVGNK